MATQWVGVNGTFARALGWLRDALDPVTCLLALLAWGVSAAWFVVLAIHPPGHGAWWLAPAGLSLAAAFVASRRFAWLTVLSAALIVVVVGGVSLVRLGLERTEQERVAAFRGAATATLGEVALLRQRPNSASATTALNEADKLANELCGKAGGSFTQPNGTDPRECKESTDATNLEDQRRLAVRKARADLATADARLALADSTARSSASTTVDSRSAALTTALGGLNRRAEAVPVAEALTTGASAVVSDVVGISGDIPLAMEALGWLLVALGALGFTRLLSTRNADRELGPVKITPPTTDKSDAAALAEVERFRTYLLRNIPEPGAVPGSNTLQEVSNLVVAVEPLVPMKGVGAAVRAFVTAVVVPRGYIVEYANFEPGKAAVNPAVDTKAALTTAVTSSSSTAPAVIIVRIRHARTTDLLEQFVVRKETRDESLRSGAYRAAAVIISSSKVVPDWARWSPASAEALATYYEDVDLGRRREVEKLRKAARVAPTSGLLGLGLAQAEALASNKSEAFSRTLETVRHHPRYQIARYRLAISASLLATEPAPLQKITTADRKQLVEDLRALNADDLVRKLDRKVTANEVSTALCQLAIKQLKVARRRLWIVRVGWNALRSDGRAEQLGLLYLRKRRREAKLIAASARFAIKMRKALLENTTPSKKTKKAQQLRDRAERFQARTIHRQPIWQVPYNLACFWSVASTERDLNEAAADRAKALLLLEAARRSPGSQQLSDRWLRTDDDLKPLKYDPDFDAILRRFPSAEEAL